MLRITASITGIIAALAVAIQGSAIPSKSGWWDHDCHIPPSASWPAATVPTIRPSCNKVFFTSVLPPEASLENITAVPEGGSHGEGRANIPYPTIPTNLPALCAVTIKVISSPSSSYRFGLFLPTEWSGRFLAVGNSGFAGGINWLDMAPGTHYGMATVSTDTGHNSSTTDSSWALNRPEKKTDWGWRALHGTVVLGKKLTNAYYNGRGRDIIYSYYSGCSTGGRQALREIQKFPNSFDGILIGAPTWWTSHLHNWFTKVGLYNLPNTSSSHIPTPLLQIIADEVVDQCDLADGVEDGIISRPDLCTFNSSVLLCPSNYTASTNGTTTCLTQPQIDTVEKVYSTYYHEDTGEFIYPGPTLGSEAEWYRIIGNGTPSPYGVGYQRNFLLDNATWNWTSYSDSLVDLADRIDPGAATADEYDISAFKSRGGKVILYHGLADGLVPAKGTELYYNRTMRLFGGSLTTLENLGNTTEFFRLFLLPGMQHCWGTPAGVDAPWNIGGAFQAGVMESGLWSVLGFEGSEEHDALVALRKWVEEGREVKQLVATSWKAELEVNSGVKRQRKICAWPGQAVLKGGVGGDEVDINREEAWECKWPEGVEE